MNASPRKTFDGGLYPPVWLADHEGIVIECDIFSPTSQRGRRVNVFIWKEQVADILKELRDVAISARSKPMGS